MKILSSIDVSGDMRVGGSFVPVYLVYDGTSWPTRPIPNTPVIWYSPVAGVVQPPGRLTGDLVLIAGGAGGDATAPALSITSPTEAETFTTQPGITSVESSWIGGTE